MTTYTDTNHRVEIGAKYVRVYELQGDQWILHQRYTRHTGQAQRVIDRYLPTLAGPSQARAMRQIG